MNPLVVRLGRELHKMYGLLNTTQGATHLSKKESLPLFVLPGIWQQTAE
jgi:hypothetical protein